MPVMRPAAYARARLVDELMEPRHFAGRHEHVTEALELREPTLATGPGRRPIWRSRGHGNSSRAKTNWSHVYGIVSVSALNSILGLLRASTREASPGTTVKGPPLSPVLSYSILLR
jgi:hypothetical protein